MLRRFVCCRTQKQVETENSSPYRNRQKEQKHVIHQLKYSFIQSFVTHALSKFHHVPILIFHDKQNMNCFFYLQLLSVVMDNVIFHLQSPSKNQSIYPNMTHECL